MGPREFRKKEQGMWKWGGRVDSGVKMHRVLGCLLYTSDAADDVSWV